MTTEAREVVDEAELATLRQLPLEPWADGVRDHFLALPLQRITGRRLEPALSA